MLYLNVNEGITPFGYRQVKDSFINSYLRFNANCVRISRLYSRQLNKGFLKKTIPVQVF